MRLAADTGARRGELAALRFDDLDARTLTIRRAISGTEITPPKSGHGRNLTTGSTTAAIWTRLHDEWSHEARLGPWVFSGHRDDQRQITPSALGHRDAATTLRAYGYALPGTDTDIADAIDRHLNQPRPETEPSRHDTER